MIADKEREALIEYRLKQALESIDLANWMVQQRIYFQQKS